MATSTPKVSYIPKNDQAALDKFLDGMATAFSSTPLSRAFITEIDDTPPPYSASTVTPARIREHIAPGITDGFRDGAELVEAGDYSALAVWETTEYRGKPFTEQATNVGLVREHWRRTVSELKSKYIGKEVKEDGSEDYKPFYHLGFIVRNPTVPNVPGSISAVMRPWLKRAEEEGVPVWLEATYEHAVDVYKHFGFRLVETVTVGEGCRSSEGFPEEGGPGVFAYAMIYDKHLKQ